MTITLTSNDEYKTYQWYTYDGNNKTNLNSTIGSWTQPLTATTQYILEVTDENGCRNNDTATVIAKPYPVVKFSYPAVCSGTPAVITATESTADEYIWPTNGKSEGNVWTSEENLVNKKSFTITVGKEECYKSHSIEIDVNDKPNISVTVNGAETNGNSVEVCSGSDVILGVTSDNKTLNQSHARQSPVHASQMPQILRRLDLGSIHRLHSRQSANRCCPQMQSGCPVYNGLLP